MSKVVDFKEGATLTISATFIRVKDKTSFTTNSYCWYCDQTVGAYILLVGTDKEYKFDKGEEFIMELKDKNNKEHQIKVNYGGIRDIKFNGKKYEFEFYNDGAGFTSTYCPSPTIKYNIQTGDIDQLEYFNGE